MHAELYGRDKQISFLEDQAKWLTEDSGFAGDDEHSRIRIVVLYGAPGVGKTRLLGELYKLLRKYLGASDGSVGYRYSSELGDNNQSSSCFSAAINPSIDEKQPHAGFYWLGARFDDPAYRQFRPFTLVDNLTSLAQVKESVDNFDQKQAKIKDLKKKGIKLGLGVATSLIPGGAFFGAALEELNEHRELAELVTEYIDPKEKITDFAMDKMHESSVISEQSASKKIADILAVMSHSLPLVIALDNTQWAFDKRSFSPDLKTIGLLTEGIRSGKGENPLLTKITELFKRISSSRSLTLKRKKALFVLTVDSAAYSKRLVPILTFSPNELDAEMVSSNSDALHFKVVETFDSEPDYTLEKLFGVNNHAAIEVTRLSSDDSQKLFWRTCNQGVSETPTNSYGNFSQAILSAGGLPLKLIELGVMAAEGISLDGPTEAELLHFRRTKNFLQKHRQNTSFIQAYSAAAILASFSGGFNENVVRLVIGSNIDFQPLEAAGFIARDERTPKFRWRFTQPDYPKQFIGILHGINPGIDRITDCDVGDKMVQVITEIIIGWFDGKEQNGEQWSNLCITDSISEIMDFQDELLPEDQVALYELLSESYAYSIYTYGLGAKNSKNKMALYLLCCQRLCGFYAMHGYPELVVQRWRDCAQTIESLVDKFDQLLSLSPMPFWHRASWIGFLRIFGLVIDDREGAVSVRAGVVRDVVPKLLERLHRISIITELLIPIGENNKYIYDEFRLEVVRHWYDSMKSLVSWEIKNEEKSSHGRTAIEMLSPHNFGKSTGSRFADSVQAQIKYFDGVSNLENELSVESRLILARVLDNWKKFPKQLNKFYLQDWYANCRNLAH